MLGKKVGSYQGGAAVPGFECPYRVLWVVCVHAPELQAGQAGQNSKKCPAFLISGRILPG